MSLRKCCRCGTILEYYTSFRVCGSEVVHEFRWQNTAYTLFPIGEGGSEK